MVFSVCIWAKADVKILYFHRQLPGIRYFDKSTSYCSVDRHFFVVDYSPKHKKRTFQGSLRCFRGVKQESKWTTWSMFGSGSKQEGCT